MTETNVHPLPTAVERLVAAIKTDLKRREASTKEWLDGTYDLCVHLAELRRLFPSNIEFGRACEEHGLGKSVINSDTRIAAVAMGSDPEAMLNCLTATERRSIDTIYRFEFPRFRNVPETTEAKAEKPKRGKRAPKKLKAALDALDLFEHDGKPVTSEALAEAAGVGPTTAKKAIAAKQLLDESKPPVEPLDPETAAPSTKARMEAWQRAETKRLRAVIHTEVRAEVEKEFDIYVKSASERIQRADRILASHKGLLSKKQFMAIVKCLHPDTQPDDAQKAEAFRFLNDLKDILMKPEEPTFKGPPLPMSAAELMARRKTKW